MSNIDTQSRREARPERITLNGKGYLRNDIIAKKHGATERSVNRGDAKGAPFLLLYGVKYRPEEAYDEYLAAQIVVRGQSPKRNRRGR
jgi:hypothetical protein